MQEKHENRHFFLQGFVKNLIKNSLKEAPRKKEEKQEDEIIQSIKKENEESFPLFREKPKDSLLERSIKSNRIKIPPVGKKPKKPPILKKSKKKSLEKNPISLKGMQPSIMSNPQKSQEPLNLPKKANPKYPVKPSPPTNKVDLGKIDILLADPRIQGIECTGPNKRILVRKDGTTLATKMSLTKEEIKSILDLFSTKSKIPLIGGVFKAAIGNLMVTAVTSEFVGDRFIIKKRSPFEPLKT